MPETISAEDFKKRYGDAGLKKFQVGQTISADEFRNAYGTGTTPTATLQPPEDDRSWIDKPAYEMEDNQSGFFGTVGKGLANFGKSGLKFAKDTAQFFNPVENIKKIAQVPGALIDTAKGQQSAEQSQAAAQALEAKVNEMRATQGMAAKAPVAPNVGAPNPLVELTKAGYETIVPEAGKLALKGEGTKALESLSEDPFQVAPFIAPLVKGGPLGESKAAKTIDAGIGKVKEVAKENVAAPISKATTAVKEGYANLPESVKFKGTGVSAIDNAFKPKSIEAQMKTLDKTIDQGISKGVKPTVAGKKTMPRMEAFYEKSRNAVKTVAENKDNIQLLNKEGEKVGGMAPQSAAQGADAINQAKSLIYNQYHEMATAAGEGGAKFKANPVVQKLTEISNDLKYNPEVRKYAEGLIPEITELRNQKPEVIEARIADYNKSLEGYYEGRVAKAKAQVDASLAAELRRSLDGMIEDAKGPGYQSLKNKYGELKTLEKEMSHRAVVQARKAPKGLIDFTDIFTGGDLIGGALTMNPTMVVRGLTMRGIKEFIKKVNDPDRAIGKMFDAAYKAQDAAKAAGFDSIQAYVDSVKEQAKVVPKTKTKKVTTPKTKKAKK